MLLLFTPGRVAQSVTCLTAYMCLTADPGFAGLILTQSHTFMEIDLENIFYGQSPPFRRFAVSYKRKYMHGVLVNRLVKLPQEKSVVR